MHLWLWNIQPRLSSSPVWAGRLFRMMTSGTVSSDLGHFVFCTERLEFSNLGCIWKSARVFAQYVSLRFYLECPVFDPFLHMEIFIPFSELLDVKLYFWGKNLPSEIMAPSQTAPSPHVPLENDSVTVCKGVMGQWGGKSLSQCSFRKPFPWGKCLLHLEGRKLGVWGGRLCKARAV